MRTKKQSHIEVSANQTIGILVGLIVMYFLLPILNDVPPEYASPITVFSIFIFSYSRAYVLSRYFNWLWK